MMGQVILLAAALARPPGPRDNTPFLGVLPKFRKDPAAYLQAAAHMYGDLVYMRLGPQHAYVVSHPDWIRDILVTNQSNFTKSRVLKRSKALLGEGLLTAGASLHADRRRIAEPAFRIENPKRAGEAVFREGCRLNACLRNQCIGQRLRRRDMAEIGRAHV